MSGVRSNWPFWNTNKADPSDIGAAPLLAGGGGVLVVAPLLGFIITTIAGRFDPMGESMAMTLGAILLVSPLVTWAVLIVAIPVSIVLARKGLAGWGIAALCGGFTGLLVAAILDGRVLFTPEAAFFGAIGVILSVLYWLAVRLMMPRAIGVRVYDRPPVPKDTP